MSDLEKKLTFGDLKVDQHFIAFPKPGDNAGHGGYLGESRLFRKINPTQAVTGSGTLSNFGGESVHMFVIAVTLT